MDSALTPPFRVQPVSDDSISAKAAQKKIDAFLVDFQSRTLAPSTTGNSAVTHQLKNLRDALEGERKKKKDA
ncbi:hypothetical protein CYLTODRAFT_353159 [Cylindrobasidium torrendii FP15055 ss-10]|uniref:Uncharacterized protein n=1 Tax=Cylindrobasidium torrendii FP15055 ss-10 TaxID=1314674 RepID=A0A0D7BB28_9AGAR|nr:hypothetical protein CYLTODRAFT_353159 [Cylindrobasidium torrendii FP15055 ss-10]